MSKRTKNLEADKKNIEKAGKKDHEDEPQGPQPENKILEEKDQLEAERLKIEEEKERLEAAKKEFEEKQKLAGDLLRAGAESILTELDDKELLQTVTLDIERAGI